ncbi:MAG: restriction endonuclease subunit S [Bacteroidetes bacterium]|nr:restriction endonuclease subunit S [Bacteroidota bacterium]
MSSFSPVIDLSPDHWKIVREALRLHVPDYQVVAFGSRATWTAKDYSDLDLAILSEDPLPVSTLAALREDLEESILPFRVDVIDLASVEEGFRLIIKEQGVTLQNHNHIQNSTNNAYTDHGHDIGLKLINGDSKSETYKNSWKTFKIGDLGRIVTGKTPSTADAGNYDGIFPFITIPDLKNHALIHESQRTLSDKGASKVHSSRLPTGAVMMSCIATIGECGITTRPSFTNQQINSLVPISGIDSRFLYYVFTQLGAELDSRGGGGSIYTNVSKGRFSDIEITIPVDLSEQRAIAYILGSLDDKIELNRRMNKTLEEMAQALFKSWFVDFEPVRAKMEGRDTGLPKHIDDMFPDRLVNSVLGEIPEGWEVTTLGEMSSKPQYGYTASATPEPKGPKFLRITDINKSFWISWNQVPHCQISSDEFVKYRLQEGDLLIARMADPGHCILVEEDINGVFASYLIRFRPIKKFHRHFLQYWSRSVLYWQLVRTTSVGTTRKSLNARALSSFKLTIPPDCIAEIFQSIVSSYRSQVLSHANQISLLSRIRDTLLPKLISGEIRTVISPPNKHI